MENKYEIEFKNIMTAAQCPSCGKKFAVKLGVDYLSRHQGQAIQCICLAFGQKQINLGRVN
jgi:predicted RNA-binding Zn-ribbon protein involved in translation (DUF1610 family)